MINSSAIMESLAQDLGWPTYQQSTVERWRGDECVQQSDYIAEEVPVSLIYNGLPHVVMLATPSNLEEFALGFSISEGIIGSADELLSCKVYHRSNGIEVHCKIPEQRFSCISDKARNLAGRTGCGLCGASSLNQAIRAVKPVSGELRLAESELFSCLAAIQHSQPINQLTGSLHAAAWCLPNQGIIGLREDVGRHNALDKLIGFILRSKQDVRQGYVMVTSRASFEMVQKVTAVGITLLIAISAPTGLAIRLAESAGLTLIGFARANQYVVYTHPQRLLHQQHQLSIQ